jgi:hypothetical protein
VETGYENSRAGKDLTGAMSLFIRVLTELDGPTQRVHFVCPEEI